MLSRTPPRSSFSVKMKGHWAKTPQKDVPPFVRDNLSPSMVSKYHRSTNASGQNQSKGTSAMDNELEGAVANQFDSSSPSREERRKTLHIPSPKAQEDALMDSTSSDSWTDDDIFLGHVPRASRVSCTNARTSTWQAVHPPARLSELHQPKIPAGWNARGPRCCARPVTGIVRSPFEVLALLIAIPVSPGPGLPILQTPQIDASSDADDEKDSGMGSS